MAKIKSVWTFTLRVFILFVVFHKFKLCEAVHGSPSITLENGRYNGVLIGIDGDKIGPTDCARILERLKTLLPLLSEKLFLATEGRAGLGRIDILLPPGPQWTHTMCGLAKASFMSDVNSSQSYPNSHIQITKSHPMTATDSLPWTKQYRPCGQPSDSILVPLQFIKEEPPVSQITDSVKAQLLLHEWTKFRYGVFDEMSYDDESFSGDNPFPPCYTHAGQAQLTCCTNSPILYAVAANESACTLEFIQQQDMANELLKALGNGSTSIMSSPYLESVINFCNESNHSPWPPTKQNLYCNRRSVSEVVFSHLDFPTTTSSPFRQEVAPVPEIRILKYRKFESAYAFVIEDFQDMPDQYKIQHVKQAIAQFLQIMSSKTETIVVTVYLFIFTGNSTLCSRFFQLRSDEEKQELIDSITNAKCKFKHKSMERISPRLILPVMIDVIDNLSNYKTYSWNVFLFSNPSSADSPESDMLSAIEIFRKTPHTMSIFTFEDAIETSVVDQWLHWYAIPNTKNVVALPYFMVRKSPGGPSSFQTTSFILDHFVGVINDQSFDSRFLQNPVGHVAIENKAGYRQFQVPGFEYPNFVKNVYIFMSIPENNITDLTEYITLSTSSWSSCEVQTLFGYTAVIAFTGDNCIPNGAVQSWSVRILKPFPAGDITLFLNMWVELEVIGDNRLVMTPSIGLAYPLIHGVNPNFELVPAFVALQTTLGFPVLDAQVRLQVYHSSILEDNSPSTQIILRDDGDSFNGADQTANDGVYSAYLFGFSQAAPLFHLLQLEINTTASTKVLESIQSSRAILLDETLTEKCCGKYIQPKAIRLLQPQKIRFQSLHMGFKTLESWNQHRIPPGRISFIKTTEDTVSSISIQFVAVKGELIEGGEDAIVASYEACCVASNGTLTESHKVAPGESSCEADSINCDPLQSPGSPQICYLDKKTLATLFVPSPERPLVDRLICALRARNTKLECGDVSQMTFEVNMSAILEEIIGGDVKQSCEKFSLSDKCLPIWIFWVVIGCLGLLVLIILIIICWWCCLTRGKRKKVPKPVSSPTPRENALAVHYTPPPPQLTQDRDTSRDRNGDNDDDPKVVKELFVNHAYIQDGDGEIKIIADNGQILRKPKTENGHHGPSASDVRIPMQESSPLPHQLPPESDMQIFKPVPMPKPDRTSRNKSRKSLERRRLGGERPEIIHPNPMLRSDSSYNAPPSRMPPQQFYADSPPSPRRMTSQHQHQIVKPPPPSRRIPPQPLFAGSLSSPQGDTGDPALVYATIAQSSHSKPTRQVTFDPHYMVPHNSTPTTIPFQSPHKHHSREPPLPKSAPPPLPNYPTVTEDSDNSTTTDYDHHITRSQRVPPRFTKPPEYPGASQLFNHSNPRNNQSQHFGVRVLPVPSPPAVNPPPVPPPRYDRSTSLEATGSMKTAKNNGAVQSFSRRQDMVSTDDEDSDEWDDGDNYGFDNTTGVSYA